eukprot:82933-Prymnesium_polylepis.1
MVLYSCVRKIDIITGAHRQSAICGFGARCEVPCSKTIAEGEGSAAATYRLPLDSAELVWAP